MKISRSTAVVLCVGAFGVAMLGLGMASNSQARDREDLTGTIQSAQKEFAQFSVKQVSLDLAQRTADLAKAQAAVAAAQQSLVFEPDQVDMTGKLFAMARDSGLVVERISIGKAENQKVGSVSFESHNVALTLNGEPQNVVDFVNRLNRLYPTGVVDSVKIEVPRDTAPSGSGPRATVEFDIKSYTGR